MLRALVRKALADLKGQRLQGVAMVVIVAAATATLVLAMTLRSSTSNPWERVFSQTHGAHVNFTVQPGTDLGPVFGLDGIEEIAEPYPTIWDQRLIHGLDKADMAVFGLPADPITIGQPQVTDGRWLQAGAVGEVVLDRSTARDLDFEVGDTIEFLTAHGKEPLTVVGLAVSGNWGAYPDWDPGLAYALPETLALIEPDQSTWSPRLSVRLTDPDSTQEFVDRVQAALPPGAVTGVVDWQKVRENLDFNNAIFVMLLGTFSLFALVAAGLVIANAIGGRVLAQGREIGLLKAVGFTPSNVTLLFLLEHLAIGLVGGAAGVVVGLVLAPRLLERSAEVLDTTAAPSYHVGQIILVLVVVLVLVVLFTLLPAWRAGRIPTVRAISAGVGAPPSGRSRLAALATRLHLPVVFVLGFKDSFARRLRSWVTVGALMLTVVCAMAALGVESTTRQLLDDPSATGGALDIVIGRGDVPEADARAMLEGRSEVQAVMTIRSDDVQREPGASQEDLEVRAVGGDYLTFVNRVLEGRMFEAPGEAVVGLGFLDLLGLSVGDTVQIWLGDQPLILTIVGRYMELDNDGKTATTSIETLREQIDPAFEPDSYGLMLTNDVDADELKAVLVRESGDQFEVLIVEAGTFAEDVNQFRILLGVLAAALMLLGLGNLLTTALLGVRERMRDVAVLKAIGCTPRQVIGSVVVGIGVLAIISLVIGIPLGMLTTRALLDYAGEGAGFGSEFGRMPPWTWIAALAPVALLLAILAGTLPAQRAANMRVTEALRAE